MILPAATSSPRTSPLVIGAAAAGVVAGAAAEAGVADAGGCACCAQAGLAPSASATAKDVSDGEVAATADVLVIKNAEGEDVTSRLNIKFVDGTIKVEPAKLTVTTPSASKPYDGNALTAEGKASGFVNGETVIVTDEPMASVYAVTESTPQGVTAIRN